MRAMNLSSVNPFHHFSEIRSVSELAAFAVASRAILCSKLGQQTEKYIYEDNVRRARRLCYHASALITFAVHVSYIYLHSKYALVHNAY